MVKVSSIVEIIFKKHIVQDNQETVSATYYIEKVSITEGIPTLCLYYNYLPIEHTYGNVSLHLKKLLISIHNTQTLWGWVSPFSVPISHLNHVKLVRERIGQWY